MKSYTMKLGLIMVLISISVFCACKKVGQLSHNFKFMTVADSRQLLKNNLKSGSYDNLGTLITSTTPVRVILNYHMMSYSDEWDQRSDSKHLFSFECPASGIDLTNGKEFSLTPQLHSTDMYHGIYNIPEVTFNYFLLWSNTFTFRVYLPEEYGNGSQLNNVEHNTIHADSSGNWYVEIDELSLLKPVYGEHCWGGYFFGNTDSTFIFNKEHVIFPRSENSPVSDNTGESVLRMPMTPITVQMPLDGENIQIHTTLSLNSDQVIQFYSGHDDNPYTQDDYIVLAPEFWTRINLNMVSY